VLSSGRLKLTFRDELAFLLELLLGTAIAAGWLMRYAGTLVLVGTMRKRVSGAPFSFVPGPAERKARVLAGWLVRCAACSAPWPGVDASAPPFGVSRSVARPPRRARSTEFTEFDGYVPRGRALVLDPVAGAPALSVTELGRAPPDVPFRFFLISGAFGNSSRRDGAPAPEFPVHVFLALCYSLHAVVLRLHDLYASALRPHLAGECRPRPRIRTTRTGRLAGGVLRRRG